MKKYKRKHVAATLRCPSLSPPLLDEMKGNLNYKAHESCLCNMHDTVNSRSRHSSKIVHYNVWYIVYKFTFLYTYGLLEGPFQYHKSTYR